MASAESMGEADGGRLQTVGFECPCCTEREPPTFDLKGLLSHLLEVHHVVIDQPDKIASLPAYLTWYRQQLSQHTKASLMTTVTTQVGGGPTRPQTRQFYMMSPDLPEDRALRQRLAAERLVSLWGTRQSSSGMPTTAF